MTTELFFRVVKEGIGVETKNLFVNAILSHVISIQYPSVGTEVRLSEPMIAMRTPFVTLLGH
jgi:hypothetical protein